MAVFHSQVGVSIDVGTPKWMVYNVKIPLEGIPIYGNLHMDLGGG